MKRLAAGFVIVCVGGGALLTIYEGAYWTARVVGELARRMVAG